MDHRVEPPSWLPEGAPPEGAGSESGDSTVPAERPADKLSWGNNGQDGTGTFKYSYDGSFTDSQDTPEGGNQDGALADAKDGAVDESQDTAFAGNRDGSFGSGEENSFGSSKDNSFGGDGSYGAEGSYGGSEDNSHAAGQDAGFGGDGSYRADGSYGADSSFSGDGSFGGDSSFDGSRDAYARDRDAFGGVTDGSFGSRENSFGSTTVPGSDHPADPASPVQHDTTTVGTYSTRLLADPGAAPDPLPDPTGGVAGAAGAAAAAGQSSSAYSFSGSPASTTGPKTAVSPARSKSGPHASSGAQPRRANLVVSRLEPWSVMKFSFLISLVAWIVLFVAVAILYYALSGLGVFDAIQKTLSSVTSGQGSSGVSLSQWTSPSRVLGYTMLIGAVNVVLITALSTVGAMIYNLVTHIGGGIEVTLKETD